MGTGFGMTLKGKMARPFQVRLVMEPSCLVIARKAQ
jgi:hypothetical protein